MPRTTLHQDEKFIKALSENISIDASFVIDWVESNFSPEEVFGIHALEEWAENNGYIKA